MTLKGDAMFKEKLPAGSKNDIRDLVNFNGSNKKSKNLHFHGLLLTVAYNASAKKLEKSCL